VEDTQVRQIYEALETREGELAAILQMEMPKLLEGEDEVETLVIDILRLGEMERLQDPRTGILHQLLEVDVGHLVQMQLSQLCEGCEEGQQLHLDLFFFFFFFVAFLFTFGLERKDSILGAECRRVLDYESCDLAAGEVEAVERGGEPAQTCSRDLLASRYVEDEE